MKRLTTTRATTLVSVLDLIGRRAHMQRKPSTVLRNAALAAAVAGVCSSLSHAAPLVFITMLGEDVSAGQTSFSSAVAVNIGDTVEYQFFVGMASIGTSNSNAGGTTITSLTPGLDGINSLTFDAFQLATDQIQGDFNLSKPAAVTTSGGVVPAEGASLLPAWHNAPGTSGGVLAARGNGANDLVTIRPVRTAGNFGGIAPASLLIGTGTFTVVSVGTGAISQIGLRWSANGSGGFHINGPPKPGDDNTLFMTAGTEPGPDPYVGYLPLTLGLGPLSPPPPPPPPPTSPTWAVNVSGNWSDAGNWAPGVPNAVGASASFLGIHAPITITVDAPQTVGSITFNNASYTVAGSSALTLNAGGAFTASVTVLAGNQTIAAPLIMESNTLVSILPLGNTLSISSAVTSNGSLTLTGAGTLSLTGSNSYTGGTTVTGGTLSGDTNGLTGNIFNNATLVFDQGFDGIYSGSISGIGRLIKNGNGAVTFVGPNSYSGATTINSGTLRAGAANAFSPSSSLTVGPGGTLDLNSFDQTVGSIGGNGSVLLGSATLTAGGDNTSTTFAVSLSGHGALTKVGNGALTLTGINTYSGPTTISGGMLAVSASANLGDGSATNTLIFNGGSLQTLAPMFIAQNLTLNAAGGIIDTNGVTSTVAGNISGPGQFTKMGTGTLVLASPTSYTGGTRISTGTLQGDTNSLLGNIVDNAALTFAQSFNGNFTGTVTGSGGFAKSGVGAVTLSGPNTYKGITNLFAGALRAGGANAFSSNSSFAVATGATLDLNSIDQTVGSLAGGGLVLLGSANLNMGSDGTGSSFVGAITGMGGITKVGVGTVTFSGSNTYSGLTTITAGTLSVSFNSNLGDGSATNVVILNGGTLQTLRSVTIGQNILLNASTGKIDSTSNDGVKSTLAGVISGTGALTKIGSGTFVLTGSNTYSGGTTILAGTIQADTNTLPGNIFNNGTVNLSQSFNGALAGSISGPGALSKNGLGTVTLVNPSTFSGATNLVAGTLRAGAPGALSPSSAVVMTTPATLDINGFNQSIPSLAGGGSVLLGSGTLSTGSNGSSTTFSGPISGSGGLTKVGVGTFTLSGKTTYTGPTTLSGGSLGAGAINVFSAASNFTLNSNYILNLNSFNQTIGSLGGNGQVVLGAATLTTGGNGASTTLAGNITGLGNLVKAGSGDMTLSGANSYNGTTTVTGGRLIVTGSFNPSSQINPNINLDGGSLINNGAVSANFNADAGGTIKGSGSFNGAITVNAGGVISPGNSPGALTSASATLNPAGAYIFEIHNALGQSGAGIDYWNVLNQLNIAAGNTPSTQFAIDVDTLNVANLPGQADNFDPTQNYSWPLIHAAGGITGFSPNEFTIDHSGFANNTGTGFFSVSQSGNDLMLNFTAVPEPGVLSLLSLASLSLLRRRVRMR